MQESLQSLKLKWNWSHSNSWFNLWNVCSLELILHYLGKKCRIFYFHWSLAENHLKMLKICPHFCYVWSIFHHPGKKKTALPDFLAVSITFIFYRAVNRKLLHIVWYIWEMWLDLKMNISYESCRKYFSKGLPATKLLHCVKERSFEKRLF